MRRYGLVIIAALSLAAVVATSAGAKSTPQIRAAQAHERQVRAEVAQIGVSLEKIQFKYDGAQLELSRAEASLKSNTHKLHLARVNFYRAQKRIMARVYSLYVNGQPSTLDVLAGAKSLSQVINRAEAAQEMSQQDAALGREALHFKRLVQTRQHELTKLRAQRAQAVATLASQRRQMQSALARQQHLLASIHTSIHQLQVQEAQREAAQRAAALARLRAIQREQQVQQEPPTTFPQVPPIIGGGSGHPEAARLALRYLGVPYVWGGASPSGFDCSGLVMYVYAQVGISLPHYTVSQWDATQPISMSQLQPGDLIFFNGLSHVGMYIGNGQMVNAPHPGSVVRIDNIYGFGSIDGARRVP